MENDMTSYQDQVVIINNKKGDEKWYDQLSGPKWW